MSLSNFILQTYENIIIWFRSQKKKNHTIIILMFFNKNKKNDVKMKTSTNMNHITTATSAQIITIGFFFLNPAALCQRLNT